MAEPICAHEWAELFAGADEGGPGYQTTCLHCGLRVGQPKSISDTIALQLYGLPASVGVDSPLTHRVGDYFSIDRAPFKGRN